MPVQPLRRLAAVVLALAAAALASCGGGDDRRTPELLDSAFRKSIQSADLTLDAELSLRGSESLARELRIRASGPFRSRGRGLPAADIELSFGSVGGQTIESGFVSTGDRVFVEFQGVFYKQPRSEVARTNRELQRDNRRRRTLLGLSGLDPRRWLEGAEERGDEEVAGVETTHVSGRLDVERVVRDLNELVRRSGAALGRTATPAPEPLTAAQIRRVAQVVRDPSFDVYIGRQDDLIRRLVGRLELAAPESERDALGGLEGGSLRFAVELADVNGDQRIEAPVKARPLAELTRSLGGTALGALGGAGSGSASPPGTTGPDAEAYARYADCLDRSRPEDTDALQRCAELLR